MDFMILVYILAGYGAINAFTRAVPTPEGDKIRNGALKFVHNLFLQSMTKKK